MNVKLSTLTSTQHMHRGSLVNMSYIYVEGKIFCQ